MQAGLTLTRLALALSLVPVGLGRLSLARSGVARELEILQPDHRGLAAAVVLIRRGGMTGPQPLQTLSQLGQRSTSGPVGRLVTKIRSARRVIAASVCARSLVRRVLRPWHRANLPNSATAHRSGPGGRQ